MLFSNKSLIYQIVYIYAVRQHRRLSQFWNL